MGPQSPPTSILKSNRKSPRRSCEDRSVSFYPKVGVVETIHFRNFTRQETHAYWFCKDEYHIIKQEIKHTLRLINQSNMDMDESCYCLRGLEHKMASNDGRKYRVRSDARDIVLDEQETQYDLGVRNDDMIREVYRMYSEACELEAYHKALEDEIAVMPPVTLKKLPSINQKRTGLRTRATPHVMASTAA
eukprot:scaffold233_cov81-Cylindrotheca_fusiformis.AAC.7